MKLKKQIFTLGSNVTILYCFFEYFCMNELYHKLRSTFNCNLLFASKSVLCNEVLWLKRYKKYKPFLSLIFLFYCCYILFFVLSFTEEKNEKALRETQALRALAVVGFGHRPPPRHRQDRLQYTAPQLASAHCNKAN